MNRFLFIYNLKITFRRVVRNKLYTLLSILGLSLGIACSFLIYSWIQNEFSYNTFHENYDEIYRVTLEYEIQNDLVKGTRTPYPVGPALKNDYEEILKNTCYRTDEVTISFEDVVFNEKRFATASQDFFEIFSFSFIEGDPETALSMPNTIVITDKMKDKYFRDINPIGKSLLVNQKYEFIITGVVQTPPSSSDIQFDFVANYPFNRDFGPRTPNPWQVCMHQNYILINKNVNHNDLENRLKGFIQKYHPESVYTFKLQPLKDIHLYRIDGDNEPITYVLIFFVVGILILSISIINYMNMFIAEVINRLSETSIKRILGSTKKQLIQQIITESTVYVIISIIVSIILIEFGRPIFNQIINKQLTFSYSSISFLFYFLVVGSSIIFVVSFYPAIMFSTLKLDRLRVISNGGSIGIRAKKTLVILQYIISIGLIISTIFIYKQLNYIQTKNLGFNRENIVYFHLNRTLYNHYEAFKNDICKIPGVQFTTIGNVLPFQVSNNAGVLDWEGRSPKKEVPFCFIVTEYDYLNTFNLKLVKGRNFDIDITSDKENYVLNEHAIKIMELENPIGKQFTMWGRTGEIIGVVKDFYSSHFNYEMRPLVFTLQFGGYQYIAVKVESNNIKQVLNDLKRVWNNYSPDFPFDYQFMDDSFNDLYKRETQLSKLFIFLSILTILISCFGLLGISTIIIKSKTKEIGIRKVMGATTFLIQKLLLLKFVKWVLIAFLIATPITYFIIRNWLNSYAYKTELNSWPFILSGIIAIILMVFTIGLIVFRASKRNPVESLRYE